MEDLKGKLENGDQHTEILELLPWYLNGTLEDEERDRVELHLQSCAECQNELDEFEALQSVVMEEELDLAEIYLQDAMEIIRDKPKAKQSARREPFYPEAEPRRERGFVLRPRLAFSFGVLLIAVLIAGIFVGNELSKTQVLIADDPLPGQQSSPTIGQQQQDSTFEESGGVRFLARSVLDQGTMTTYLGNSLESQEQFILSRQEDGTIVLDSEIQDARFAGNSGNHRLILDENFRAETYTLTGGVVYKANRVDAAIERDHALYTLSRTTGVETRRVELGAFPVMWDFSVFSQFIVIHRAILDQLESGASVDEIAFSALTPQILDIKQMHVAAVEDTHLTASEGEIEVVKYVLEAGSTADPFVVELYARNVDDQLIAVYMPKQPGLGTTTGLFSYRSDLYDELEAPQR